jgi:hypothetical protein
MEVASPLTFGHAGTKRSMACSPELMDASELVSTATAMENVNTERLAKRRRFDNTTVESLSEDFSAHGIFFHKSLSSNNNKNKKTIFGSNGGKELKLKDYVRIWRATRQISFGVAKDIISTTDFFFFAPLRYVFLLSVFDLCCN